MAAPNELNGGSKLGGWRLQTGQMEAPNEVDADGMLTHIKGLFTIISWQ